MKVELEIRECAWIGDLPTKWQGHAYIEGQRFAEPLISGEPATSELEAKRELEKALTDYVDLGLKAKSMITKTDKNITKTKKE